MTKSELVELFKPRPTQEEGRAQVVNSNLSAAYQELSSLTGIPEQCFDYRAVSEQNAVTRAPSESIGNRFYLTAAGNIIDEWVFIARVGVDADRLEATAESLARKLNGACTLAVLFATQQDWRIYKICYAIGHRDQAEKFAEIFEVNEDVFIELGQFISFSHAPQRPAQVQPIDQEGAVIIPKPFILLAGISGTGKTRFVREQGKVSAALYGITEGDNYCLVPVRPDWHEPSDLLGYISRIGNDGPRYIVTDLLRFIVAAWQHATESATATEVVYKPFDSVCPFWLCLDEMNLAPVEQYFADYLSVLETRKWDDGFYSCDSLLKPTIIDNQLDDNGRTVLWEMLKIAGDDPLSVGLREYFSAKGIPLPPNLIVAGTVNMDETTHGFSRKVIDRALTIDFGEFFPNDYDEYYEEDRKHSIKPLGFPRLSGIHNASILASVVADADGRKTIGFLKSINSVLDGTPFQLAYRALNEALLSLACFMPSDDIQLQGVWDDFLMMKVLPRIEGDAEKLGYEGEETGLLFRLIQLLKQELSAVADSRPDLLRVTADGAPASATCRSLKKLAWMQKRLEGNNFTSFWP